MHLNPCTIGTMIQYTPIIKKNEAKKDRLWYVINKFTFNMNSISFATKNSFIFGF
jgi:hypothetical protein